MSTALARTIAVVDDHIEALSSVITLLTDAGWKIEEFNSIEELENSDLSDCLCWLVDKRFGARADGAKLFKRLKLGSRNRVVMMTAYANKTDKIGKVQHNEELDTASVILNKPKSFTNSAKDIADNLNSFYSNSVVPSDLPVELNRTPNALDSFEQLSESQQEESFDNVLRNHANLIEDSFSKGAVWICIFGENADDFWIRNSADDIPDPKEVDGFSENSRLPAFVIDRSLGFHNTNCGAEAEHGGANVNTYPHLSFEITGHSICEFHFDSGADTSLFDKSFIDRADDVEFLSPRRRKEAKLIQSKLHYAEPVKITCLLQAENAATVDKLKSARGTAAFISGLSLSKWHTSDLVVKCSEGCKNQSKSEYCVFRKNGLIGRDFYVQNGFTLVLCHDDTRVKIL